MAYLERHDGMGAVSRKPLAQQSLAELIAQLSPGTRAALPAAPAGGGPLAALIARAQARPASAPGFAIATMSAPAMGAPYEEILAKMAAQAATREAAQFKRAQEQRQLEFDTERNRLAAAVEQARIAASVNEQMQMTKREKAATSWSAVGSAPWRAVSSFGKKGGW